MDLIKMIQADLLGVEIYKSRDSMGKKAGGDIAACIRELLEEQEEINIIFAAAPSQNEVLEYLVAAKEIDWKRINAFHMDEYVGLSYGAPQRFGNYLKERIFSRLPFRSVSYLDGNAADLEAECAQYAGLLRTHPVHIVCMGIGENGHIAFNDPPVADFHDSRMVKVVELDSICRQQQVNDGCFAAFDEVPKRALTLTVPTLMNGQYLFCCAPSHTKAVAVKEMVTGTISEGCPATILRTHKNARLYCDSDSAKYLLKSQISV